MYTYICIYTLMHTYTVLSYTLYLSLSLPPFLSSHTHKHTHIGVPTSTGQLETLKGATIFVTTRPARVSMRLTPEATASKMDPTALLLTALTTLDPQCMTSESFKQGETTKIDWYPPSWGVWREKGGYLWMTPDGKVSTLIDIQAPCCT